MADNRNMDMNRLRQEAIQRAREMQTRALGSSPAKNQTVQSRTNPAPVEEIKPSPSPKSNPRQSGAGLHIPVNPPKIPHQKSQSPNIQMNPVRDVFDILLSDSERTMLMVLVFILIQEKADTGLIFVLIYLLL